MKSKKRNAYWKYIQTCWIVSGFLLTLVVVLFAALIITERLKGEKVVPAGAGEAPINPPTEALTQPTSPSFSLQLEPEILRLEGGTTDFAMEWRPIGDASYLLQYRCADEDEWYCLETKETNIRITGLEAGEQYEICLQYSDGEQTCDYAKSVTVQTKTVTTKTLKTSIKSAVKRLPAEGRKTFRQAPPDRLYIHLRIMLIRKVRPIRFILRLQ